MPFGMASSVEIQRERHVVSTKCVDIWYTVQSVQCRQTSDGCCIDCESTRSTKLESLVRNTECDGESKSGKQDGPPEDVKPRLEYIVEKDTIVVLEFRRTEATLQQKKEERNYSA